MTDRQGMMPIMVGLMKRGVEKKQGEGIKRGLTRFSSVISHIMLTTSNEPLLYDSYSCAHVNAE